jgi:hypothetical protein
MRHIRLQVGVALLALAFALGLLAAPRPARADAAAPAFDACSLLTADEITKAIGMKVDPAVRDDSGAGKGGTYSSTCLWRGPNKPEPATAWEKVKATVSGWLGLEAEQPPPADTPMAGVNFVILNAIAWPEGSDGAKNYIEDFRASARAALIDNDPVSVGIGDEAIYWGTGVAVRKGTTSFGISVRFGKKDKQAQRAMEEALARQAVARL